MESFLIIFGSFVFYMGMRLMLEKRKIEKYKINEEKRQILLKEIERKKKIDDLYGR